MRVRGARRRSFAPGPPVFLRRFVMTNILWLVLPFAMISLYTVLPRGFSA
jgi:hypothetical protein